MTTTRTNRSTPTTCRLGHLNQVNHHVGNNIPPRRTTIIEDIVNKTPHNGKTGTTGESGKPLPVTTNHHGHPKSQAIHTLQPINTLLGTTVIPIHIVLLPASLRLHILNL